MEDELDLDLFSRIQAFIAADVNNNIGPDETPAEPGEVQILGFAKTLHHWKVYAAPHARYDSYYEISSDGDVKIAIVNVYKMVRTSEAVI